MIDNITMEEVLICLGIETVRVMRLETALEVSRSQNKQLSGQMVGAGEIRKETEGQAATKDKKKSGNPRKKADPKGKARGVKHPTDGPPQLRPPSMVEPVNTGDLPG